MLSAYVKLMSEIPTINFMKVSDWTVDRDNMSLITYLATRLLILVGGIILFRNMHCFFAWGSIFKFVASYILGIQKFFVAWWTCYYVIN